MTKIISVLSPCSEVGKTMIAINLATAFSKKQENVLFVSTDLYKNVLQDASFSIVFIPHYELLKNLDKLSKGFDTVVIDGTFRYQSHLYSQHSSLILIPVLPSSFVINKTSILIDSLNSNPASKSKNIVLFNRTTKGEPIDPALIKKISDYKVEALTARINEHNLFDETFEKGKTIYCPGESVAVSEFNTVVEEIIARLQ